MIGWIIVLFIYVLSIIWYRHEAIKFHEKLTYIKPDFFDMFAGFIPFINIIGAFVYATDNGLGKKISHKFFNIK